jgi:hypothetical protein
MLDVEATFAFSPVTLVVIYRPGLVTQMFPDTLPDLVDQLIPIEMSADREVRRSKSPLPRRRVDRSDRSATHVAGATLDIIASSIDNVVCVFHRTPHLRASVFHHPPACFNDHFVVACVFRCTHATGSAVASYSPYQHAAIFRRS